MSRISGNTEAAEAMRQKLVPRYYELCTFRRVIAQPWDHTTELTPQYVGCEHPEYRKQNDGECLGQCALAREPYGNVNKTENK